MRKTLFACFAAALFVFMCSTSAFSYDPRMECDNKAALTRLEKAKAVEKTGKLDEAYRIAREVGNECQTGGEGWSDESSRIGDKANGEANRIANLMAVGHEKVGRLEKAVDWYKIAGKQADYERVLVVVARGIKSDKCDVFTNLVYNVNDPKNVEALKTMAAKHADSRLAAEEPLFAKKDYDGSYELIIDARCWGEYVGATKRQIAVDRAAKRGEAAFAGSRPSDLKAAESYFYAADMNNAKVSTIWKRAEGLGDGAKAKGDLKLAVEFYDISRNNAKYKETSTLLEKAEAEKERKAAAKESVRQKSFEKDQDALEKELGL